MTKSEFVKVKDHKPGIRVLTISRPTALNALNSDVLRELRTAVLEAEGDDKVRVVVLTGDGEKAFIAGADIAEMKDKNKSEGVLFAKVGHEITLTLELMNKPTIAAVNGFALGGGTEMAIACDFILASENAVFGQPEVGLGIIPGFGGTVRLARFVGLARAKELIFSGRKIKADEALELGLVNHVYPQKALMKETLALAQKISENSHTAISAAKKLLNEFVETLGRSSKLDAEAQDFGELFGSPDQREGMGAFVEKRKPKFKGLSV